MGKRNVNGEGNIRQRKDGRYEGRAYVLTTDGREIRKSVYGRSWEEVHDVLTRLQADRISGRRVADTKLTVGEYLNRWLEEIGQDGDRLRASTYNSYSWITRHYLIPALGKKRLASLQAGDIRRALTRLRQVCQCCALGKDADRERRAQELRKKREGRRVRKDARPIVGARCCAKKPKECCEAVLSQGTIRYVHRVLKVALQDAVRDDILADNVAKKVSISQKYRPRFVPWTGAEGRRFLAAARGDRWYALYAVALSLGLRRGEALGLRWSDVDLTGGVLYVRQALQRVDGKLTLGLVKSDDSDREVALPATCIAALKAHREQQAGEREAAGTTWQDYGLVFTTRIGTPVEPRNVNRHFTKLCERAEVRRIRFHDLRHSCATLLYEQGVKLEHIQDVLGHSSPTITKTIYVDVTKKVQREAVDRLDYLFDEDDDQGDDGPAAVGAAR